MEVEHAVRLGFDPAKVIFDSPCKTRKELLRCFELGVLVNLDCMEEVDKLAAILDEQEAIQPGIKEKVQIGIRINPQVGAGTIASVSTATKTSKFGTGIVDYHEELVAAYCKHSWLKGLHCHVGSQGCAPQLLVDGVKCIVQLATEINAKIGHQQITLLDIGGGLPMNYWSDEESPTFGDYTAALKEQVPELFDGSWKIFTEFGRSIVQKAGWIGSRVEYTKKAGGRNIATVHCGSNMMLRTAYLPDQWKHDCTVLDSTGAVKEAPTEVWDVAGPLCFSGDMVVREREMVNMDSGDHLVIHDCGGYTVAMYSRYNSRPCPPVYAYEASNPDKLITFKAPEPIEQVFAFWE